MSLIELYVPRILFIFLRHFQDVRRSFSSYWSVHILKTFSYGEASAFLSFLDPCWIMSSVSPLTSRRGTLHCGNRLSQNLFFLRFRTFHDRSWTFDLRSRFRVRTLPRIFICDSCGTTCFVFVAGERIDPTPLPTVHIGSLLAKKARVSLLPCEETALASLQLPLVCQKGWSCLTLM